VIADDDKGKPSLEVEGLRSLYEELERVSEEAASSKKDESERQGSDNQGNSEDQNNTKEIEENLLEINKALEYLGELSTELIKKVKDNKKYSPKLGKLLLKARRRTR
jgi:hypothetical protein